MFSGDVIIPLWWQGQLIQPSIWAPPFNPPAGTMLGPPSKPKYKKTSNWLCFGCKFEGRCSTVKWKWLSWIGHWFSYCWSLLNGKLGKTLTNQEIQSVLKLKNKTCIWLKDIHPRLALILSSHTRCRCIGNMELYFYLWCTKCLHLDLNLEILAKFLHPKSSHKFKTYIHNCLTNTTFPS